MAEDSVHVANEKLVRDFLLAWERRDTDEVVMACSEDTTWTFGANPPIAGRDTIRSFVDHYKQRPGGPYEVALIVASEKVVMAERRDHLVRDGKDVVLPVCGVFEIEGGRITKWRDYYDSAAVPQ